MLQYEQFDISTLQFYVTSPRAWFLDVFVEHDPVGGVEKREQQREENPGETIDVDRPPQPYLCRGEFRNGRCRFARWRRNSLNVRYWREQQGAFLKLKSIVRVTAFDQIWPNVHSLEI